jgi:hypothetical protein
MKLSDKEKERLKTKYGSWALVTGASSGIGLELSKQLADAGFHLVLNAREVNRLAQVASQLHQDFGVEIKTIHGDVSSKETIENIIQSTESIPLGLIVLSAGFGTSGPFHESDLAEEVKLLQVNCEAVLCLTHHYAQRFSRKKKGGIILLSSMVAFQGVPYSANYAASKAYVQSLAEALAVELKPFHVDVLSAAPGPVASGFEKRANMKMDRSLSPAQVGVPILKALGKQSLVLPGLLTKILVYSLRTLPRWGKVKIMGMVMGGFTKHQRKEIIA